jgi:hypothetical protein
MKYLESGSAALSSGPATPDERAAVDAFKHGTEAEGHRVLAGGLDSPRSAIVIGTRGAEPVILDGNFQESKEHVAGFWVFEAPDPSAARRLAADGSKARDPRVEVRRFRSA